MWQRPLDFPLIKDTSPATGRYLKRDVKNQGLFGGEANTDIDMNITEIARDIDTF